MNEIESQDIESRLPQHEAMLTEEQEEQYNRYEEQVRKAIIEQAEKDERFRKLKRKMKK